MNRLPIPGRPRSFEGRWARCPRHEGIGGQKRYQWYVTASEGWRCRRELMRERAGQRCQVCGATERLDVHHNSYGRLGREDPQDLVVLCRECHDLFHQRRDPRLPANAAEGRPVAMPAARRRRRRWPWLVLPLAGFAVVAGVSPALPREWLASLSAPKPAMAPMLVRTPTPLPERAADPAAPLSARTAGTPVPLPAEDACDPAYPTVCLPPAPPRLTCAATGERSFPALPPDPHGLDSDRDGLACEPIAGG